jgi:hypothetical protein
MKKFILLSAFIIVGILVKANDLIVEEGGLPPSYSSISAAITAANTGDRIFVKNKSGNLPWLENITISKSLDLLAYVNDSFFIMQGSVTIIPTSTSTIDIIGMINLNGSVSIGSSVPTGSRSIVRILDGQFLSGSITCGVNNFDVTVEGCSVNGGDIQYEHGSIVGNTITNSASYGIFVESESTVTTDTSYIFGNRITCSSTSGYGIYWSSSTMNFDIRNNFVTAAYYGMYINPTISNSIALNKIYNNTVSIAGSGQSTNYGMYIAGSSATQIDVQNNVVDRNDAVNYTYYGIYANVGGGGNLSVTYNYVDNAFSSTITGSITVNLNNTTNTAISLNGNGSTVGGVGQNGGNPGVQFYDTDLTINDAGCYGGSYTLNNFNQFTGSAVTWLTNYQYNVRTGTTLGIKANSYDR